MRNQFKGAIPPEKPADIVAWAEENVRLPGSVRSEAFDASISPWILDPLRCCADMETKRITLVKPVQSGGTRVGLIALCWWSKFGSGQIQYNWENDTKATNKWESETQPTLEACKALDWRGDEDDLVKRKARFLRTFIYSQGVFVPEHLDSDSITYQVNEEIHAWEPGHLAKARGRQTAVWFPKAIDISNAGNEGDQLHQALTESTNEPWGVLCPGCREFHIMRVRWEDERPDHGGLRYNSEKAKRSDGTYNYATIAATVFYQMPCGYRVPFDNAARKALSLSGKYLAPRNAGAPTHHRSFTLEAVAVDFIDWIQLIQEKHLALRALRAGEPKLWKLYMQERECRFWSLDDRPRQTAIVLSARKKSPVGMPDRAARLAFFDRQQGSVAAGESPHWWGLVRDVAENGASLLVWEGKLENNAATGQSADDAVVSLVNSLGIPPGSVTCDSGDDTDFVYEFCLKHGFNACKGEGGGFYLHHDGSRHPYSDAFNPTKPDYLFLRTTLPPFCKQNPGESEDAFSARFALQEPRFFLYWKEGMYDRLLWIRSALKWEDPSDVSEAYKMQMESWEVRERRQARTNERVVEWVQIRKHDHLWAASAGIVMMMEMAGLAGNVQPPEGKTK